MVQCSYLFSDCSKQTGAVLSDVFAPQTLPLQESVQFALALRLIRRPSFRLAHSSSIDITIPNNAHQSKILF